MLENAVELEKEAQSGWNLGTDQKLLAALGKFSTSLGEKTQSLVGKVDELSSDTVEVECKLRNTFNDFLMLADTQFIENVRFHRMSDMLSFWYNCSLWMYDSSLFRLLHLTSTASI